MLSEYLAPQLHFAGLGAEGQSAADAAQMVGHGVGPELAGFERRVALFSRA